MDGLSNFRVGMVVCDRANSLRLAAGSAGLQKSLRYSILPLVILHVADGVHQIPEWAIGVSRFVRAANSHRFLLRTHFSRKWAFCRGVVSSEGTWHGVFNLQRVPIFFARAARADGLDHSSFRLAVCF